MARAPGAPLVVDANVLIDYLAADANVLGLVSHQVGPVHIPRQILREVPRLGVEDCERLGLRIVDESVEQLLEAGRQHGRLSFYDHLCLILARENGWTCVTNDRALRRACAEHSVPVLWGLELMIQLVAGRQMTAEMAVKVASAIRESNPHHVTEDILVRFENRLKEVG